MCSFIISFFKIGPAITDIIYIALHLLHNNVLAIIIIMISCNAYYSDIIVMPSVVVSTTSTAVISVTRIIMTSAIHLITIPAVSPSVVSTTATSVVSTSVPSVTPSMYASVFVISAS